MGRHPCCDKLGVKKGPWTPEEDIILVSYIQEHGPGNWRSVPINTGLLRCSKSCRLRWTNYLRPGIKRGNFTPHEEAMIIHLQALLGNKWAAIASYLPQRTDNDIKNYWNTHLKKKLKKAQPALNPKKEDSINTNNSQFTSRTSFFNDRRSADSFKTSANSSTASTSILNQTPPTYASSAENISRLLEGWMKTSPKPSNTIIKEEMSRNDHGVVNPMPSGSVQCGYKLKAEQDWGDLMPHEEIESILSFDHENLNAVAPWNSTLKNQKSETSTPPLTFFEHWLMDESNNVASIQVEENVQLPPVF